MGSTNHKFPVYATQNVQIGGGGGNCPPPNFRVYDTQGCLTVRYCLYSVTVIVYSG